MKTLRYILLLTITLSATGLIASAQDGQLEKEAIDTVRTHIVKYPEHLIGVRYSVAVSGTFTSLSVDQKMVVNPLTFELLYTYYHPLWDYIGCFGFQTGIRYTGGGLRNDNYWEDLNEAYTAIQVPILSAFHFDVGKHLRFPVSIGPYAGYRLRTDKEGGWDCFDKRFELGLEAHGGAALRFGILEIYFEAGFQYCLTFLYDPEKLSSDRWLYTHPYSILGSVGLHIKLK